MVPAQEGLQFKNADQNGSYSSFSLGLLSENKLKFSGVFLENKYWNFGPFILVLMRCISFYRVHFHFHVGMCCYAEF